MRYAYRKLSEAGKCSSSWCCALQHLMPYIAGACSMQTMVLMTAVRLHVLESMCWAHSSATYP